MPFKLYDKPTFFAKVSVRQPNAHGTFDTFEFRAEFQRRSAAEVKAILEAKRDDRAILDTEWVGWADVQGPDGRPLEVTEASRTALLAEPGVEVALVRAWLEMSFSGYVKN